MSKSKPKHARTEDDEAPFMAKQRRWTTQRTAMSRHHMYKTRVRADLHGALRPEMLPS